MQSPRLARILCLLPALSLPAMSAPEDEPIFSAAVQKVLAEKCLSCHNADKKKGKLDMTSLELMLKGGDSEKPGIVPGKPDESEILRRIHLPLEDDDHMPPEDKPQLTAPETALLRWWVEAGAPADLPVKDAPLPEDLKPLVTELAAKKVDLPSSEPKISLTPKELDPATRETIARLEEELGASILQIAQTETGLMFNAINVADKFGDAELAKFAPLAPHMEDLNLARTQVTDAGLAPLAAMQNLRRLRLEHTGITDAGLDHLSGLPRLEYLNLFDTKVSDAGLEKLAPVSSLRRLYVYQTQATKEGAEKLHAANPNLVINLGWDQEVGRPALQPVAAAAPAPEPAPADPSKADPEAPFYAAIIQPILNRTCTSCHGEEKDKGDLRVHDFDHLMKGGGEGPAVVAGNPDGSLLLQRVLLPLDDDDHMPPEDKPQPTPKEIGLLKLWIAQGADPARKVKDLPLPDDLK